MYVPHNAIVTRPRWPPCFFQVSESTPDHPKAAIPLSKTERFETPLPIELTDELMRFWAHIFGDVYDTPREAYLGNEGSYNTNAIFVTRERGELAGTCQVTSALALPSLGGLSQVATAPKFRGLGIATNLCRIAAEEFRKGKGEALFLGTGNPNAARIYRRLGWQKLDGANVMVKIISGDSPKSYLADYFKGFRQAVVAPASPHDRIPIIPLLLAPHSWQVLDANAEIYSTKYFTQRSCMGLYRRYNALTLSGRATIFSARTSEGHVIGLSSAQIDDAGECQIDGFAAEGHHDSWLPLIRAAIEWHETQSASKLRVKLSFRDKEKRSLFQSLGFQVVSEDKDGFGIDDSTIHSLNMERLSVLD